MNTSRVFRWFLMAFVVVALAGFFRFGIGRPLASSASPAALPSPRSAATSEQLVPAHAASAGDDGGPGQAELILVGSP
jgi:hypothetical protein